jgi:DNA-binding MarR family transcriptional regulator
MLRRVGHHGKSLDPFSSALYAHGAASHARSVSDSIPNVDEAVALLQVANRAVSARADRLLARRGLSRTHHRILTLCRKHEGLRVAELLARLEISKQAAHAPLRELITAGLVESKADRRDRRGKQLRLTATGKTLERQLAELEHAAFERAFADEGKRGVRAWASIMRALISTPTDPSATR